MNNDGSIPIYTQKNWNDLLYLWPQTKPICDRVVLFPQPGEPEFAGRLSSLKKMNPYLANLIESQGEGHIVFRKAFKDPPPKNHFGYTRGKI